MQENLRCFYLTPFSSLTLAYALFDFLSRKMPSESGAATNRQARVIGNYEHLQRWTDKLSKVCKMVPISHHWLQKEDEGWRWNFLKRLDRNMASF